MSEDHWNDSHSKSESLRARLAAVGIYLDDEEKPAPITEVRTADPPVDREEIRRVLVDLGAPAGDIDWISASCPSLDHALAYRPTIKVMNP